MCFYIQFNPHMYVCIDKFGYFSPNLRNLFFYKKKNYFTEPKLRFFEIRFRFYICQNQNILVQFWFSIPVQFSKPTSPTYQQHQSQHLFHQHHCSRCGYKIVVTVFHFHPCCLLLQWLTYFRCYFHHAQVRRFGFVKIMKIIRYRQPSTYTCNTSGLSYHEED